MNRAILFTTVAAGAALVGASVLARRTAAAMLLAPGVIPIVTPFIDINVAERVLATMERLPDQPITLVLHTLGGCVTACVMIANALRQFSDATAVIPYMAVSGGTLIALPLFVMFIFLSRYFIRGLAAGADGNLVSRFGDRAAPRSRVSDAAVAPSGARPRDRR